MMNLLTLSTRALACCLVTLALGAPAAADKITVWVDDQHTRQTQVEKLDPDQIADPSSFSIGAGIGLGNFGVSLGWSKEKGVEYSEKAEKLIQQIKDLCEEFNKGELSLESYQRRIRRIFNAIETARLAKMEIAANTSIERHEAGRKLDDVLGLPPLENQGFEQRITGALDEFRTLVETIRPHDMPLPSENESFDPGSTSEVESSRAAVRARLAELDQALEVKPIRHRGERELVNIWKDKARTVQIAVPKLDVEGLVQEFEQSLCVQMKYSPPLLSFQVGKEASWTLQSKAKYNQQAQVLIIRYRKLCMDYNSGMISQEGYFERLTELMEAERRAFAFREEFADRLIESKNAASDRLDEKLGGAPDLAGELKGGMDRKRTSARDRMGKKRPGSAVEKMSEAARADMKAWDAFVESVGEFKVDPPSNTIEVWEDDSQQRKISVAKVDTDIIAESVRTRLSLHITFFDFGPECSWARERGLDYGHAAQLLIIKSKQLCTDFNAGLLSLETYLLNSRQIDASVEKAAAVRQGMIEFYSAVKGVGRDRADAILDRERDRFRR